ncbi:hypothetical protein GGI04_002854 [Coemansia thaxteri]|nr:hypothetical protein GGI04_002854 [Coemansia thaxteri]
MMRAVFGSIGHLLYYLALGHLPMGIATVLFFTNPLFTALLARYMLGESFGHRHRMLAAAGMAGIAMVILPFSVVVLPLFGFFSSYLVWSLCALLGAASVALAYVSIRKAGSAVHALVHVTYFGVVGAASSVVVALVTSELPHHWHWTFNPTDVALVVGVGTAAFAAQLLMNRGLQLAPAGPAVMMRNTDIVISFVLDAVMYHTVPGITSLIGAVVITGSVIGMSLL